VGTPFDFLKYISLLYRAVAVFVFGQGMTVTLPEGSAFAGFFISIIANV